jgi:hypothetical protein
MSAAVVEVGYSLGDGPRFVANVFDPAISVSFR